MCVAIPAVVTWIGEPSPGSIPARVSSTAGEREIDLALLPSAKVGDHVVTHSGYAIRIVPVAEAEQTHEMITRAASGRRDTAGPATPPDQ